MDYDAIIVGARVAGSALTALLGQQGHRVLLLDKAHFPSDTLSTHFFRVPALLPTRATQLSCQVNALRRRFS
jgi:2-polyprenyl-6-methoxyphenol hydroxylase-like FAD-dependent oxidoreductase